MEATQPAVPITFVPKPKEYIRFQHSVVEFVRARENHFKLLADLISDLFAVLEIDKNTKTYGHFYDMTYLASEAQTLGLKIDNEKFETIFKSKANLAKLVVQVEGKLTDLNEFLKNNPEQFSKFLEKKIPEVLEDFGGKQEEMIKACKQQTEQLYIISGAITKRAQEKRAKLARPSVLIRRVTFGI